MKPNTQDQNAQQPAITPLPWAYLRHYENGEETGCTLTPMGYDLQTSNLDENEANAAFIVRACNAHQELVEACQNALEWMADEPYDSATDVCKQLTAALKKATSQP